MDSDVREALRHLTTAFENHLEAIVERRGPGDAAVDDSYEALAEAFERYEELLDSEFGEDLPLMVDVEDDDEDLDEELDGDLDDEDDEVSDVLENAEGAEIEDLEEFDLRDDKDD